MKGKLKEQNVPMCLRCITFVGKSYKYTDEGKRYGKETHYVCHLCGSDAKHLTPEQADELIRKKARERNQKT